MEKKKKLIILGVILLLIIVSGATFAILTWNSTMIKLGINTNCFTIDYTRGGDITGSLKLVNEEDLISNGKFTIKEGVGVSSVNIGIKSTCSIEGYGNILLNITNISTTFTTGDSKGALKYAVLRNTSTITDPANITTASLLNETLDIVIKGSITSNEKKLLYRTELSNAEVYKYIVVIYIDNNLAGNDITSATFSGNISSEAEQKRYGETPEYCFTLSNKDETNKTASIKGYNCYEGNGKGYEAITDVIIPSEIEGYTINATGTFAFYSKKLTSIFLPETISSIGSSSFRRNTLTNIIVHADNPTYDSRNNCNAIIETASNTLIQGSQNTIIPNTIITIGSNAFENIQLTNIVIPDSVTTIKNNAFYNNQLTNIKIPNSVTAIENNAFNFNPLMNIVVDSNNSVYDSRDNCNAIIETASNTLIQGSQNTIIPNTIVTLKTAAFRGTSLASITIPASVQLVENMAFSHTPLANILVDSNNSVYDSRDNCNAIIETASNTLIQGSQNTVIPSTISVIGENAFFYNQIEHINLPDTIKSIENGAFEGNKLTNIKLPSLLTKIGNYTFEDNQLTTITIPETVTAIGSDAFFSNQLTSIILPDSVTTIGSSAFAYNNLNYVYIGNNSKLTSIGSGAFSSSNISNSNLKKIYYNGSNQLPWIYAVNSNYSERNNKFVTGTVPSYTSGTTTYNEVLITTGQ